MGQITAMQHAGNARKAGLRILSGSVGVLLLLLGVGGGLTAGSRWVLPCLATLAFLWLGFALFTVQFFRDPEPIIPHEPHTILAPAHGTVDWIEETCETEFMGGACRRVSIFLSVFDVHVQRAPIAGRVAFWKRCAGKFLSTLRTDCSAYNEHLLIGFESPGPTGPKVAVRLIAGLFARRITSWVQQGQTIAQGTRTSLIQFGSRVDLLVPMHVAVLVQPGDKVKGGETIVARYS